MKNTMTLATLVVSSLLANVAAAGDGHSQRYSDLFCRQGQVNTANFPQGTLPFPDNTNITTQFAKQGIVFSSDASGLPPEFVSHGSQDNLIVGGIFQNPFKIIFDHETVSVSVTLRDQNSYAQTHSVTAFDDAGNIVDQATFMESGDFPDRFTLTVSSCRGIAFVVVQESPFGAEFLNSIVYASKIGN